MFWPSILVFAAYAQIPATAVPKFEVASVKRCQEADRGGGGEFIPGRIALNCLTVTNLIRMAYLIFPTGQPIAPVSPTVFQQPIAGGPAWMDSELYRIDAKAEGPVNVEMMRGPMLQALLEDRFHLKLRRESKQVDVYELTVGKSGPKLTAAKEGACVVFDRNHPPPPPAPVLCGVLRPNSSGGVDIPGVTAADLCRQLSAYVDRDIVDKTGTAGLFDVHLEISPADLGFPGTTPDATSTFTPGDGRAIAAALEKLGLQMRPAKGTAPLLIIERVERPTQN